MPEAGAAGRDGAAADRAPGAGILVRLGEAMLLGAAAAIAASVPAAFRVGARAPAAGAIAALVAAAGLVAVPIAVAVAVGRSARRSWHERFAGRSGPAVAAIALAVVLALPVVAATGAALRAHTHHRALAGATFAVVAGGAIAACAILAVRIVTWARPWLRGRPVPAAIAIAAAGAIVVASPVGRPIVRAAATIGSIAPATRALCVDVVLAIVAVGAAVAVDLFPRARPKLALAGPAVLAALAVAGAFLVATDPSLGRALAAGAGLAGIAREAIGVGIR